MIYTLTTNPAVDMNLACGGIRPNIVNRASGAVYSPNGKGVNVALTLRHFGIDAKVLGFFGGFTGKYIIGELEKKNVEALPIWVEETTRINVFVNDGGDEYKFVNSGAFVPEEKQAAFLTQLAALSDCRYLAISGSLPPGVDPSYYDRILAICKEKQIEVILDISAPKLKELLACHPLLIKPNGEELLEIFGIALNAESDVLAAMRRLKSLGARNVLLTLGANGAYFCDGAAVYHASARAVKLVSSACAGDAALGAFLSEWLAGGDIEAALKKAGAAGANVAESDALGDFKKVDAYQEEINVRKAGLVK